MGGGHGACANPNLDLQKPRVQFWLRHPHFCQCCVFWDVGLMLALSWARVKQFYGYFVACVGLCGARVRTILGLSWALLGHVGTILGLSWALLGHVGTFWARLAPYWAHVEPFWAILGAVLSMQGVCKKHRKYQQKNTLFGLVAGGLCSLFGVMFVSFLWGMLHLVCACLTSGLCWAILGYVSAMLGSC